MTIANFNYSVLITAFIAFVAMAGLVEFSNRDNAGYVAYPQDGHYRQSNYYAQSSGAYRSPYYVDIGQATGYAGYDTTSSGTSYAPVQSEAIAQSEFPDKRPDQVINQDEFTPATPAPR